MCVLIEEGCLRESAAAEAQALAEKAAMAKVCLFVLRCVRVLNEWVFVCASLFALSSEGQTCLLLKETVHPTVSSPELFFFLSVVQENDGYVCAIARVPLLELIRGGTQLRFAAEMAPHTTIR